MRSAVGRIAIKARARYRRYANFPYQVLREGHIIRETEAGDVGHDVIRAARLETAEAGSGKNSQQAVAPLRVFARERVVIILRKMQSCRSRFLQRCGRSYSKKIVNLAN